MKLNLRKVLAVVMTVVAAFSVSAQNLYIFGSFNGWDPANSIEMWQENGVYIMEDIEFGAGGWRRVSDTKYRAVSKANHSFELSCSLK